MTAERAALQLLGDVLGARLLELEPVVLTMPATRITPSVVAVIKQILPQHPGPHPCDLRITNNGNIVTMRLPATVSQAVKPMLVEVLGTNVVSGS